MKAISLRFFRFLLSFPSLHILSCLNPFRLFNILKTLNFNQPVGVIKQSYHIPFSHCHGSALSGSRPPASPLYIYLFYFILFFLLVEINIHIRSILGDANIRFLGVDRPATVLTVKLAGPDRCPILPELQGYVEPIRLAWWWFIRVRDEGDWIRPLPLLGAWNIYLFFPIGYHPIYFRSTAYRYFDLQRGEMLYTLLCPPLLSSFWTKFISRQQSLTRPEAEVIPTSSVSMLTDVEDIAIFSSTYCSEKYLCRVAGQSSNSVARAMFRIRNQEVLTLVLLPLVIPVYCQNWRGISLRNIERMYAI